MSFWTGIRDAFQTVASVVLNYYYPGSSIVTSKLVSKGAQKNLASPVGQVATLASGITGAVQGNLANYGKTAQSIASGTAVSDATTWATQAMNDAQSWVTQTLSGAPADSTAFLNNTTNAIQLEGDVSPNAPDLPIEQANIITPESTRGTTDLPNSTPTVQPLAAKQKSTGFVDKAIAFANKNPGAAVAAGGMIAQGAGGVLSGVAASKSAETKAQADREAAMRAQQARQAGFMAPNGAVGPNFLQLLGQPPLGPDGRPLGQVSYPVARPGLINAAALG